MGLMSKAPQIIDGVVQTALPRYQPPRGMSERVADLLDNKKVKKGLIGAIDRGLAMGGDKWYRTGPLRDMFLNELGEDIGPDRFAMFMDRVAATSPRSRVGDNVRNASYYYTENVNGRTPKVGDKNPQPYGHMAQKLHQGNVENLFNNGSWDVFKNPKPASFSQNLQGNFTPVTVDAHATRLPAMLSKDPRWLETSFSEQMADGTKRVTRPQQMFANGEIGMKGALERPNYWASMPNANEYGAIESLYTDIANKKGILPADAQASAWIGGGDFTGLGSEPNPFMFFVMQRAEVTAQARGITPQQALRDFINGKAPLLGVPATMAAMLKDKLTGADEPQDAAA